jgi:hypothetical protein
VRIVAFAFLVGTNIAVTASKQTERKYEADLKNCWQEQQVPAD